MDKMIYIWVVIAFLGLIFEMGSPGLFYFLSFSFGALLAALVAFFSESLVVQGIAFIIGTGVALAFLKYWLNAKFYFEGKPGYKSNIYALQGKKGYVTVGIGKHKVGQVNLNGQIWIAQSVKKEPIVVGTDVRIVRVEGCRLIVDVNSEDSGDNEEISKG
ncbi:NfeD family protein [bacterium]|jgi:membrane protein implicated in regulation of membrane protease activity|nr:NfeD family protein [bacterium]